MKRPIAVSMMFYVSALYDGAVGLAFLLKPLALFRLCGVTPVNHPGYVQFSAALLLVFAWMFFRIAGDPVGRRSLIPHGMLLKVSYCAIVAYYWITTGLPYMWKPFAVADAIFLVLYLWAYSGLGRSALSPARPVA
jgi:hypothetical protein